MQQHGRRTRTLTSALDWKHGGKSEPVGVKCGRGCRKAATKGGGGEQKQLVYSRIPLPSTQINSPSASESANPSLWEPSDALMVFGWRIKHLEKKQKKTKKKFWSCISRRRKRSLRRNFETRVRQKRINQPASAEISSGNQELSSFQADGLSAAC